jgi:hypothetical protein
MCEIDNAEPNLRVLQCVDPSAGFRFTVQSRIRASKAGVSLLGPRPAWRLKSPASRSGPNRFLQRPINASLQSSFQQQYKPRSPSIVRPTAPARRPMAQFQTFRFRQSDRAPHQHDHTTFSSVTGY